MSTERTLIVFKPDAMERGLVGEILSRLERVGLRVVQAQVCCPTKELLDQHYQVEVLAPIIGQKSKDAGTDVGNDVAAYGRMVLGWNQQSMMRLPVLAMVIEGTHAVSRVRTLLGATDPQKAAPGTIRGDLSTDSIALANIEKRGCANLLHASGNLDEAKAEIALWFGENYAPKKSKAA